LVLLAALPAGAQQGSVTVWYINGVPGTPVDVYWDNVLKVPGFQPGGISDPLVVPPHTGVVHCRPAGAPADGPVVAEAVFELPPGNVTMIMHLDSGGAPTMSRFLNDTSGIGAGQGRLTVRHTAAAPAVDVSVAGGPVLRGISTGNEVSAPVPAGAFEITVALANSDERVTAQVEVPAGAQTIVYPIGSAEEGTLDMLVQTITGNAAAPAGVPSGGGATAPAAPPPWTIGVIVIAALVTVVSAVRLSRSRA
jgi:hypothetical protein